MALSKIKTNSLSDDAVTAAKIATGTIVAADLAANSVDSSELVDGSVDFSHMSVNSINSDQYVDGSIDTVHIADLQVTTAKIAADAITAAKIADDAINSEHYTDGSIDTAHIADNQVTLAKMAGLARGKIIYGDASGDPAALAVGGAGTALTSNGTDISWGVAGTSWQAVVTGATTMVSGRGYFVNTSSSAYTMTLPASPSIGDFVHIIDYAGTFDTNNCTVGRNSEKILGATSDLVVSTERAAFQLVYVDSTQGWLLTEK